MMILITHCQGMLNMKGVRMGHFDSSGQTHLPSWARIRCLVCRGTGMVTSVV